MSILQIQRALTAYLVDEPSDIMVYVGGDAEPGLAVYHHAYRAQLTDCLRDTFERVWAWIGDDAFETAALRYIEARPPRSWTLNDFGGDFAESLSEFYESDCEIAELALLDWNLRQAFNGSDTDAVDLLDLSDVDWDSALLRFVPTLHVLPIKTNCGAIWTAINAGETPPAAEQLPAPAAIRVWRVGLSPQFRTIEAVEQRALDLLTSGATFTGLCDSLAADSTPSQASETAGRLLASWIRDGLLMGIEQQSPRSDSRGIDPGHSE